MKNMVSEYGITTVSIISIAFFFVIIILLISKKGGLSLVSVYNTNMLYDNELMNLDKGLDNFDVGQGALDRTIYYNQPHFYENDEVGYLLSCPTTLVDNNPQVYYSVGDIYNMFASSSRITYNAFVGGSWKNDVPITAGNGGVLIITKYTPIQIDAPIGGGSVQNKVLIADEPVIDKFGNEVMVDGVVQTTPKIQYTVNRYALASDGSAFVEIDEDGNELKNDDGSFKSTFYINWDISCRYKAVFRYLDTQLKSEYTAMFTNDIRTKELVYEDVFENWIENKDEPEEVALAVASLIDETEVTEGVDVYNGDNSAYEGTTWYGMEDESGDSGVAGSEEVESEEESEGSGEESEDESEGSGEESEGSEESEGDSEEESEGSEESEGDSEEESKGDSDGDSEEGSGDVEVDGDVEINTDNTPSGDNSTSSGGTDSQPSGDGQSSGSEGSESTGS